jgi:hypothetical protein
MHREELPVELHVIEDLSRNRLTVFFRLLLALPHLIWLTLWSIGALFVAIVAWFIVLVRGRLPDGLHQFFTMYLRYATHVYAYVNLAADPFPRFLPDEGYEVDVEFAPPPEQNRWRVAFRIFLAIPALLLSSVLGGGFNSSYAHGGTGWGLRITGVLTACAVLTWFYALATRRAPEGVARLQWYCLHYGAQVGAYLLFVTDRYPTTDPERVGVPWPAEEHPVELVRQPDDGTRSPLTTFFRLLLAIPHLVWLLLWGIAADVVAIINWVATLIRGESPPSLHDFLARYLRYQTHVIAYTTLMAEPYPGFTGEAGGYPVDVAVAAPEPQDRWTVGFRLILAIPAFVLSGALFAALVTAALLAWFTGVFTGRIPDSLRRLGMFAMRYSAQATAYGYLLLTPRYPYAGPPA